MGNHPKEFWTLTPLEFMWLTKAYNQDKKEQSEMVITQAWTTAKLVWAKKLPELDTLLGSKKKVMTDEQMMKQAIALTKLFGGEVITDGN